MNPRRLKTTLLLCGIATAAFALLAWTQPWFALTLNDARHLDVGGASAAGAVPALALASMVLNAALAIAGPVFRVVLGLLEVVLATLIVWSGVAALVSPIAAFGNAVSDFTGVSGTDAVASLVVSLSVTAWPLCAAIAGVLLAAVGIVVVASGSRWPTSGRKYSAVGFESADGSRIDDWDALSRGDDPT